MYNEEQWIYVLRLRDGKYYVGKAGNVIERCNAHCAGNGSEWTKKYPVDKLVECLPQKGQFDEDNKVKELMMRYGIPNVRGGTYSRVELTQEDVNVLRRELSGAKDVCFGCGAAGHFVTECPSRMPPVQVQVASSPVVATDNKSQQSGSLVGLLTAIAGAVAESMSTTDNRRQSPEQPVENVPVKSAGGRAFCVKCGRFGHLISSCYAKTHADGHKI